MILVPTNWAATAELSGYSARYLVEIPALNLWFTAGATQRFSGLWRCDEGLVCSDAVFVDMEHGDNAYQELIQSLGSLNIALAESTGIARVSSLTVRFLNHELISATLVALPLNNAIVNVKIGWANTPYGEFVQILRGIVDSTPYGTEYFDLVLTNGKFLQQRNLSVPLGGDYFPATPQENKNKHIPALIGRMSNVETIDISGDVRGTLAFSMGLTQTTLFLKEFSAPFPETGTLTIGTETGITYTQRRVITLSGVSYLYLSGLVRGGSPTTHNTDDTVTLTSVIYERLIGYEISVLNAVRSNGTFVSPAGYTFIRSALRANQPVSLLQFSTSQTQVTVDVHGRDVSQENLLTNGSFETGDTTGWTLESGGGVVVDQTPRAADGIYQAELTGVLNSYRALYQDVSVTIGQEYQVALFHRNEQGNLLVNGGFENGDLSGWTVSRDFYMREEVIQATPGQESSESAEGDWRLELAVEPSSAFSLGEFVLYQDVTVANATQYVFTMFQQSVQLVTVAYQEHGKVFYSLGTTANPIAYLAETQAPPTLLISETTIADAQYEQTSPAVFTTTTTTARVTIRIVCIMQHTPLGTGGPQPPSIGVVGGGIQPPPNYRRWQARVDGCTLQLGSVPDTSEGALRLGIPSNPGQFLDVALPLYYTWFDNNFLFIADASPLRVSLRSRYTGTVAPTRFDGVTLRKVLTMGGSGSGNPVDAIAYIIDTFLPLATRNVPSFQAAFRKRQGWVFAGYIPDPGDSDGLLQEMAYQCQCTLFENNVGEYTIIAWDFDAAAVYEFQRETNIVSISLESEPADNIYTSFIVHYGQRTRSDDATGDFSGTASCDARGTTSPKGSTLSAFCQYAETFAREHRLEIYARFIDNLDTANKLLEILVQRHTFRKYDITLRSWLNAAHLEIGDAVMVLDDLLPYDTPSALCEVRGKTILFDTGEVDLTLRTLRQAGVIEDWEPEAAIDLLESEEPWEAAEALTETSFDEPWEAEPHPRRRRSRRDAPKFSRKKLNLIRRIQRRR